jgi:hypothetical protein
MMHLLRKLLVTLALMTGATAAGALDINKSFSPTLLQPTQTSRIRIEILNNQVATATAAAFEDVLPAGVFIATPANIVSSCGGSVSVGNDASSGRITLSGGAIAGRVGSIAGTCFIEVNAYAASAGTFINQIPIGALTATQGGGPVTNDQIAEATLVTTIQNVTGTLSLGIGGNVLQGNEVSTRTLTLSNPNSVDLTGVDLIHNLAAQQGSNVHALGPVISTCGGSTTITDTSSGNASFDATSVIALSGGTIPAGGSCTITWTVEPSRDETLV